MDAAKDLTGCIHPKELSYSERERSFSWRVSTSWQQRAKYHSSACRGQHCAQGRHCWGWGGSRGGQQQAESTGGWSCEGKAPVQHRRLCKEALRRLVSANRGKQELLLGTRRISLALMPGTAAAPVRDLGEQPLL